MYHILESTLYHEKYRLLMPSVKQMHQVSNIASHFTKLASGPSTGSTNTMSTSRSAGNSKAAGKSFQLNNHKKTLETSKKLAVSDAVWFKSLTEWVVLHDLSL